LNKQSFLFIFWYRG